MNARRWTWLAVAAVVAATCAAYANTFAVPLLFDDLPSILDNPSIRQWRTALVPPGGFGFTVSGRPLLNFSLAANYALGGFDVRGYHELNLLIHVTAGLVLFGLARRTLRRPAFAPQLREQADAVAFALALLWTLHPLQTEAVTYIIQRAESLMGLFFLLTLYCSVRASDVCHPLDEKRSGAAQTGWRVVAVAACLAGMATKEVMVAAPLVVWLYDRTFVAGDFRAAWRGRRGFYAALFATWLPLGWLVASTGGDRGGTFRFAMDAVAQQWRVQGEALLIYLKLAVWPAPLAFEYGQIAVSGSQLIGGGAVVLGLVVATGWALRRRPVSGFFGASFFLILAPTCLVPGVTQTMAEHRMYLPLAAVLALVIGGAVALAGRRAVLALLALAVGAGVLTARRNADYASDLTLWRDTVAKRPGSALAQSSLGTIYYQQGKFPDALRCYEASLRADASSAKVHFNAGLALGALGRSAESIAQYSEAVRLLPHFAQANARLGAALIAAGRSRDALAPLREAIGSDPVMHEARNSLGLALAETGQLAEAVACFQAALRLKPDYAEAECNWGTVECRLGHLPEARQHLGRAVQLRPDLAEAHFNLGLVAAASGRDEEARVEYAEAVRRDPNHGEARLNLGIAFAQEGKFDEALGQLRAAVQLRPAWAEAHANLAVMLAEVGRLDEAIASYEEALRLRPDYAQAHFNFGSALVQQRRWAEAKAQFAAAVRLAPDSAAAREMLERLESAPPAR